MLKRLLLIPVLALAATMLAPVAADADSDKAQAAKRYRFYTACSVKRDATPAHVCPKRGKKGAFFTSLRADVQFDVCVTFPGGPRLCARAQEAVEDEVHVNPITSHQVGKHVVTWFVDDRRVGTYTFRIRA